MAPERGGPSPSRDTILGTGPPKAPQLKEQKFLWLEIE